MVSTTIHGYLIATDWVSDVLHGQEAATQTLANLALDGVAISLISYGELYEGVHYGRDRESAPADLRAFLLSKPVLPRTIEIMERFALARGQLPRQLRHQIGDLDLLIAATAFTHDLILLTRNVRDFPHIPNLRLFQQG